MHVLRFAYFPNYCLRNCSQVRRLCRDDKNSKSIEYKKIKHLANFIPYDDKRDCEEKRRIFIPKSSMEYSELTLYVGMLLLSLIYMQMGKAEESRKTTDWDIDSELS